MESLAAFLDSLNVATLVNAQSWFWPVCEMIHFIGMALLIGTVGVLDGRVLGLFRGIAIASLERFVPLGIAGFVMNLVTGFIFIAGNPIGGSIVYLTNLALQIKLALILIAGANLLVWYATGIAAAANATEPNGDALPAAKAVAAVSFVAWIAVIVFGRLIMYNDTLLYALGL